MNSATGVMRTAVVTGASQGWGRAAAEGLASSGARVVLNGRSGAVDALAHELRARGHEAVSVRAESDTPVGVDAVLDAARRAFGRVDIWVNSLGYQHPAPLVSLEHAVWEQALRVQLTSIFLGTQCAACQMIEQGGGGRIINIVGGGAYGVPGAGAHAASKGGALAATYSWAEELRPHGITVNAIRGGVRSPGMEAYLRGNGIVADDEELDDEVLRSMGFYAREEAAPLVVWLASDDACDVTGFHIGIDGARIVVYERVGIATELVEATGWTVEALDARLRPVLATLPRSDDVQRRPPDGRMLSFEDRR